MIAQLRGRLRHKEPGEVILDVGGVGYQVFIPVSTYFRLGDPGSEAELLVHTHVREDTIALFGFLTADEKQLFELLIEVAGVGPRLALSVLSGIEAPELVLALQAGDLARLTRIPGVGKKTAERLVLELRDKLKGLVAAEASGAPGASALEHDLVSALANLGYSRPEAQKGVERALRQGEAPFEDLLRRTLRILSGRS
ncbi:MAG: Holliday junction branch migration protein RuvA [Vicinamibacteria bacterium]